MEQAPDPIVRFSLVRQHRRMLANMNYYLTPESRILDFGCGEGQFVYEYRDAGFDAYGFDIRPAVKLRRTEDERYFGFALTGKPVDVPEFEVDRRCYRIPFDDESFDFVYSTSTLEHVLDHELAFAETARVTKKGGVGIHIFPPKLRLIEPHMYVPMGGAIRRHGWYLLWALLGIRNEYQRGLSARETARRNFHYSQTGLGYPPVREIVGAAKRHFREVDFVPHLWELGDRGFVGAKGALLLMPRVQGTVRWLYDHFWNIILFVKK